LKIQKIRFPPSDPLSPVDIILLLKYDKYKEQIEPRVQEYLDYIKSVKGKEKDKEKAPWGAKDDLAGIPLEQLFDRMNEPAFELDLISPDSPLLSEDNRKDLSLFDVLNRSHIQLQQLLGLEAEIVEREAWNHDTSVQLIRLSETTKMVPFGTSSELFDLRPTEPAAEFGQELPILSASKKGKEKEAPQGRRSIFNLLPENSKDAWLGDPDSMWFIIFL